MICSILFEGFPCIWRVCTFVWVFIAHRYFKKNEESEQHKWFFTCPCQMETGPFSL
ncbi:hypothetical protein Gotur_005282, partial [Gossypium turneri]